jgi:hypothetical protein
MKLVAVSVALAACSATPAPPPNSVEGGEPLVIADSVWTVAPLAMSDPTGQAAFVVMSTEANLCDRARSNTVLPGEKTVTIELTDIAGASATAPSAPGDYTVPIESVLDPKTAWLGTSSYDARCAPTGTGDARWGTITIASVDTDTITGSFDVYISIGNTGDVTGTFTPQYCPDLANALHGAIPACQP